MIEATFNPPVCLLQNHPESGLKTCAYNARHIVQQEDLAKHMATCLDRQSVENGKDSFICSVIELYTKS